MKIRSRKITSEKKEPAADELFRAAGNSGRVDIRTNLL
jgi:hypothetical protein